jgi:flagellar hook-basal body complex protein FliE
MIQGIDALSPISLQNEIAKVGTTENGGDFLSILKDSLNEVNEMQVKGDEAITNIATGQVKDLHSAAIAIDKAEISMKVMLEVRNKALSAYKEILRTPI